MAYPYSSQKASGKPRRKDSSRRWLTRQARDPYQAGAWRSRAAHKLIQIDEKHDLFQSGQVILDLGAAPGSWSEWARARIGRRGRVVAVDMRPMEPLRHVLCLCQDINEEGALDAMEKALGGKADCILSDMAPNASGHRATDRLRAEQLGLCALDAAFQLLKPEGALLLKIFQGAEAEIVQKMKSAFGRVSREKPAASRKESSELYLLGRGFQNREA